MHAAICGLPRVNDIAVGIALMLFGTGLAFFLGKPLIEPTAPILPAIDFGWWSDVPQVRARSKINVLFLIGVALAPLLVWALTTTRWGLILRTAGESADAARAMGYLGQRRSACARPCSAAFSPASAARFSRSIIPAAGTRGSRAGRASPRSRWSSSRAGIRCCACWASLLFGGAAALGPALQSVGVSQGYYLFNAAPYILTLLIMIITCSPKRTLVGAPAELSITK